MSRRCPHCQETITVNVNGTLYRRWLAGHVLIQNVFPDWGIAERFLSGLCPPCWNDVIGDGEEGDEPTR
jgi:hypothetical protein